MGNRTKIAESIQFNNNSPSRVKESAADVCILDCNENDKSFSDISVIMHEDRRTIETNQPHKNEDKRSKPHNTNLCKNAAPNLSSNVRNNDKQHGDLHTSNTSLNNNPNIEAPGPQQIIIICVTYRPPDCPLNCIQDDFRQNYVRALSMNKPIYVPADPKTATWIYFW